MFVRKFANWIQFANGTKSPRTGQNICDRAAFADGTEHISCTWQLPEVLSPINTIAWRLRLLRLQKRLYKAVYRGLRMSKKGKHSRPSSASPPPPPPPGRSYCNQVPGYEIGDQENLDDECIIAFRLLPAQATPLYRLIVAPHPLRPRHARCTV